NALGLCQAQQIGDRDAGDAEDRVEAVQFQRIDDKVKAVRQFRRIIRCSFRCAHVIRPLPGWAGSSEASARPSTEPMRSAERKIGPARRTPRARARAARIKISTM